MGKTPGTDDDDGDDVGDTHALQGEETVVLEEEGHFGAAEASVVEEQRSPEGLPVKRDQSGRLDGEDVVAEAILCACSGMTLVSASSGVDGKIRTHGNADARAPC